MDSFSKMRPKKSRSNKAQIRMLVDYMSTNDLATGDFTGPLGNRRAKAQWLKLKNILKNYGPDRTIEQWKQTWKDLKKTARQENASAHAHNATEHTEPLPIVSEISKKILDTLGLESSSGSGLVVSSISPISDSEEINIDIPLPNPIPASSSPATSPITCLPSLYLLPHSLVDIPGNEENVPPSVSRSPHQAQPTRPVRPQEAFVQLHQDNNAILQNIASLLAERNELLREQNRLMAEANGIARRNSFSRRFCRECKKHKK